MYHTVFQWSTFILIRRFRNTTRHHFAILISVLMLQNILNNISLKRTFYLYFSLFSCEYAVVIFEIIATSFAKLQPYVVRELQLVMWIETIYHSRENIIQQAFWTEKKFIYEKKGINMFPIIIVIQRKIYHCYPLVLLNEIKTI